MAATDLADPPMVGGAEPRLADPRGEAEVAHQLLRAREAADLTDRRDDAHGDREIDAGDRHQPAHVGIVHDAERDLAIQLGKALGEAIKRAHLALDGDTLIVG